MRKRTPWLTWFLIIANTAAFVLAFGIYSPDRVFASFAFQAGAFLQGEWYRVLTAGFLHAGLSHLFWNMVFLFLFGRVAERVYGRLQMLGIYLVGMVVGTVSTLLLPATVQVVGASGAVFGLMGATILLEPMRPIVRNVPVPLSLVGVAYLIPAVFNAFNLSSGVAHIAHVTGALAGGLVALRKDTKKAWKGLIAVAAFTALLLGIGIL